MSALSQNVATQINHHVNPLQIFFIKEKTMLKISLSVPFFHGASQHFFGWIYFSSYWIRYNISNIIIVPYIFMTRYNKENNVYIQFGYNRFQTRTILTIKKRVLNEQIEGIYSWQVYVFFLLFRYYIIILYILYYFFHKLLSWISIFRIYPMYLIL